MQLKKGDIVEVNIERLAFGGDGIGKCHVPDALLAKDSSLVEAEGMVTFVPNTVPGDRVKISLDKIKKNRLEGAVVEFLERSTLRIKPRCRHFDVCGGCAWQNLSYPDQLNFKHKQVEETLRHLGGFSLDFLAGCTRPILACAEPFGYRNKMEFSFGDGLHDADSGNRLSLCESLLGLHLPGRRYDVFDLEECFLPSPRFSEIVRATRAFVKKEGLTIFRSKSGSGFLRNLVIREGQNTGELMVNLITSDEDFGAGVKQRFVDSLTVAPRFITSLLWTRVKQGKGHVTFRETNALFGSPVLHEELRLSSGRVLRFDISPDAFFQTNTFQAQVLYEEVICAAGLTGKEIVYDLYCGTGTIALFCAHAAQHVYGVELNAAAVLNGRKNAEMNKISNVTFAVADVSKFARSPTLILRPGTKGEIPAPDVIIVDPPRVGLDGNAPLHVAALKAPRLVYVSCNPSTLARDLKFFVNSGYALKLIQPVDMFPHTTHIETVAVLDLL